MIKVNCYFCASELFEPGALIYSPPDALDCKKLHVCVRCWPRLEALAKPEISADEDLHVEFAYHWRWQHGPAPGLTFYSGRMISYGSDYDTAYERAMRDICMRGSFQRNCITLRLEHPGKTR